MRYQPCRWYDPYPGLTFVLKLIKLMPTEKQSVLGERLIQFLTYRKVETPASALETPRGNRWYDDVDSLVEGLERLKDAPPHIKQQGTDFLLKLLEEDEPHSSCA